MTPEMIKAAAEHYHLDPGAVAKAEIYSADGQVHIVFEVVPSGVDLLAIFRRASAVPAEPEAAFVPGPDHAQLRTEYNAMPATARAKYGSFARYVAFCGMADPYPNKPAGWEAGPGLADGSAA